MIETPRDRELEVEARVNDQYDVVWYGSFRYGSHRPRTRRVETCQFCSRRYKPHPGFADHRDKCEMNPMNRPHIFGTAIAVLGDLDE